MPYPDRENDGQDAQKTEEELDAEALKAFHMIQRGESRHDVAATLGISQRTLRRRLDRAILSPLDVGVLRAIELARLEDLTLRVHKMLDGQVSNQDARALVGEARQLVLARARLRGLFEPTWPVGMPDEEDVEALLPDALRGAFERARKRNEALKEDALARRDDDTG